jgi:hypothetical protein
LPRCLRRCCLRTLRTPCAAWRATPQHLLQRLREPRQKPKRADRTLTHSLSLSQKPRNPSNLFRKYTQTKQPCIWPLRGYEAKLWRPSTLIGAWGANRGYGGGCDWLEGCGLSVGWLTDSLETTEWPEFHTSSLNCQANIRTHESSHHFIHCLLRSSTNLCHLEKRKENCVIIIAHLLIVLLNITGRKKTWVPLRTVYLLQREVRTYQRTGIDWFFSGRMALMYEGRGHWACFTVCDQSTKTKLPRCWTRTLSLTRVGIKSVLCCCSQRPSIVISLTDIIIRESVKWAWFVPRFTSPW